MKKTLLTFPNTDSETHLRAQVIYAHKESTKTKYTLLVKKFFGDALGALRSFACIMFSLSGFGTLLIISSLTACQSTQKIHAVEESSQQEVAVQKLDPLKLIGELDKCINDEACKSTLDPSFNEWLLDKNYVPMIDEISTDEEQIQSGSQTTTSDQKIKNTVVLSSQYLNNQLVKGALNEWLTWKRPQLINTWQYYQFLKQDMQPAFKHYHIDENFILAIMAQESGGKVHSRSRAGAGGLFQLMPATARRLGLSGKIGSYDLRFNPKESAYAAAKYISEQSNLYQGDKTKILAAYNSGENRFRYLNKKYKNKSLWDKNFYYSLPRETRHYIPVVIAAMLIFQNPEKFNVTLDAIDTDIVNITTDKNTSLSELAICLGQESRQEGWFRILRNLNSGIKADSAIKSNTEIRLPKALLDTYTKCQNSKLIQLAKSFHDADFQQSQTGVFRYKVRSGDSLGKIAHKFRCTTKREIAYLNNLKAPRYLIRAGKYLKIPEC